MAIDRGAQIHAFLNRIGWSKAQRQRLAGDASARRYERLSHGPNGAGAVLMDAPPMTCSTTGAFVQIATFLRAQGFSAPRILHADLGLGLLLLEDLGDNLFTRIAQADPQAAPGLYDAATDFLIALHNTRPPQDVALLDSTALSAMIGVTYDWYRPARDPNAKSAAIAALGDALGRLAPCSPVLALRDFHGENLIWLAKREGVTRVGLLDFQDAFLGHPAYDLISLIRDARHDVPEEIAQRAIKRYLAASGHDEAAFTHAAATLAVQRNLRILGVFARLALRDAKPVYLAFMPRVWRYLMRDLAHPDLQELQAIIRRDLPAPNPEFLQAMRAKCPIHPQTHPMPQ